MNSSSTKRWQFSLRALLLLIVAAALLLFVWRTVETEVFLWVLFVCLLAAPAVGLTGKARLAYLASLLAIYGPFLVMVGYTYLFVACTHCKVTTLSLLPYAPGLLPIDLTRRWLELPRLDDAVWFATSLGASAAMITGLTWMLHTRGRLLQVASVAATLAACSFAAVVLLALIRA